MNDKLNPPRIPPSVRMFESLYREHFGFVRSAVARYGVPSHALDDVAQMVFITFYARLDSLRPNVHPRVFLYGIARRTAANYRRKQGTEIRKRQAYAQFRLVDDAGRPHVQHLEAFATRELIRRMLRRLPMFRREAFILFEYWGMSAREISEALDVNINTVRGRIGGARDFFRQQIADATSTSASSVDCRSWLDLLYAEDGVSDHRQHKNWAYLAPMLGTAALNDRILLAPEPSPGADQQTLPTLTKWVLASSAALLGLIIAGSSLNQAPELHEDAAISAHATFEDSGRSVWAPVARPEATSYPQTPVTRQHRRRQTLPATAKQFKKVAQNSELDVPSRAPLGPQGSSKLALAWTREIRRAVENRRFQVAIDLAARLKRRFPEHPHRTAATRWELEAHCRLGQIKTANSIARAWARAHGPMAMEIKNGLRQCRQQKEKSR